MCLAPQPHVEPYSSSHTLEQAVGMPDDATKRFGRSAPLGAAATEHAGLQIEKDGVACPPWWLPPFMANHGQVHSGNQVAHVDVDDGKPHRDLMSHQSAEQPAPADSPSHAPPSFESSNSVRTRSFIAESRETNNSWMLSALLCAFVFLLSVYAFDGKVYTLLLLLRAACTPFCPAAHCSRLLPAPCSLCSLLPVIAPCAPAPSTLLSSAPHVCTGPGT